MSGRIDWLSRTESKIGDWNQMSQMTEEARTVLGHAELPTRLVLTNGCYDILHPGHVQRLHAASRFGDILIVTLDADEDVRRAKGRLSFAWRDRALLVACLSFVAGVTWHTSEPCWRRPAGDCTLPSLIRFLRPDVWVARDYSLPAAEIQAARDSDSRVVELGRHGQWSSGEIAAQFISSG